MRIFIFFCLGLIILGNGSCKNKSHKINCVDFESSLPANFIDSLKTKRIILIGEQGHGDGGAFLLKTKLVRLMHVKAGFNSLTMEGMGFWETPIGKSEIKSGGNPVVPFFSFLNYYWSYSEQYKDLMKYIGAELRQNKLDIFGIDENPSANSLYNENHTSEVGRLACDCEPDLSNSINWNYFRELLAEYLSQKIASNASNKLKQIGKLRDFQIMLNKIYIALSAKPSENYSCKFLRQHMRSLYHNTFIELNDLTLGDSAYFGNFQDHRDSMLFENLNFYLENNPNSKVIVLAANFHISRGMSKYLDHSKYPGFYKKKHTLGDYLYEEYGNQVYSIAIDAISGKIGYCTDSVKFDIDNYIRENKIVIDSTYLEYKYKSQCETQLIYFNKLSNLYADKPKKSMIFGVFSHIGYWQNLFDAMILIKEMEPATMIKMD